MSILLNRKIIENRNQTQEKFHHIVVSSLAKNGIDQDLTFEIDLPFLENDEDVKILSDQEGDYDIQLVVSIVYLSSVSIMEEGKILLESLENK